MSAEVLGWLAFAGAMAVGGYWMGFLTGRESADAKWQETVADLRIALRRARDGRYTTADDARPE